MATELVKCYTNNRVRIELDLDGGTHSIHGFSMDLDSSLKTTLYKIGDPVKEGYTFMGWRYDRLLPPLPCIVDFPVYEDHILTAMWLPAGVELIGDNPISEEYKLGRILQSYGLEDGETPSLSLRGPWAGHMVYKLCRKDSDGSLNVSLYNLNLLNFGTIKVQPFTGSGNGYKYSFQYNPDMCSQKYMPQPNPYMFLSRTRENESQKIGPFTPHIENWVDFYIPTCFSNTIGNKNYSIRFDLSEWMEYYEIEKLGPDHYYCSSLDLSWSMGSPIWSARGVFKKAPLSYVDMNNGGDGYWKSSHVGNKYSSLSADVEFTLKDGLIRKFKALS